MSSREVSQDEIIGVWLKREFEGNWERYIKPFARFYVPNLTKEQIKDIVDNPNYQNSEDNNFRFRLFSSFRVPLLHPVCNGVWCEENLDESEFKELCVIARDPSWVFLSNSTGKLSVVSERVFSEPQISHANPNVRGVIEAIYDIERSEDFDKNLILLQSEDSQCTTILEGNKTAVALYIKHYFKKEATYEPFRVFLGHLENKSIWQW